MADISFSFVLAEAELELSAEETVVRARLQTAGIPEADLAVITITATFVYDPAWRVALSVSVSGPLRVVARIFDVAEALGWAPEEG